MRRPLFAAVLVVTLAACASGRAVALVASKAVPAATGTVEVRQGENDNRKLKVTVDHLAPPDRLTPPASVYVVWTKALTGGKETNVGALHVDRNLRGELETTTPLRSSHVLVTAESSPTVEAPSGAAVLQADVTE
jgi:hypothetical protein